MWLALVYSMQNSKEANLEKVGECLHGDSLIWSNLVRLHKEILLIYKPVLHKPSTKEGNKIFSAFIFHSILRVHHRTTMRTFTHQQWKPSISVIPCTTNIAWGINLYISLPRTAPISYKLFPHIDGYHHWWCHSRTNARVEYNKEIRIDLCF